MFTLCKLNYHCPLFTLQLSSLLLFFFPLLLLRRFENTGDHAEHGPDCGPHGLENGGDGHAVLPKDLFDSL